MGGGMGDAFSAAMDGDDEPMPPQAEPTKPTTQPKEATADPNAGLTDVQKQAVDEKNKGNEAYKKKDFETALSHYNKAIELDPTNITYYTNKAGQIIVYLFLLRKQNIYILVIFQKAVFFEQNEYTKCIETCEQAVDIGRENRADYKLIAK